MIENISPINPDKCPPVIENSEQTCVRFVITGPMKSMEKIYQNQNPSHLEKELNSII